MEWISVKDRLPDETWDVLVYAWGFTEGRAMRVASRSGERWFESGVSGYDVGDVTHWMPLPEPPKE